MFLLFTRELTNPNKIQIVNMNVLQIHLNYLTQLCQTLMRYLYGGFYIPKVPNVVCTRVVNGGYKLPILQNEFSTLQREY